jgi:Predicted hydrolase (HAD superfamily)
MSKKKIIIFTDLDGSLLDKKTFKFDIIEDYFKELISSGIIIILNSSKTESELLDFNKQNNLNLSFISENGSSIHGLNKIHQNLPDKVIISRSKNEIQKIYDKNISLDLKNKIVPILELNIDEQKEIFGLPLDKLSLATKRMYSIPVLFKGTDIDRNNFFKVINDIGLTAQSGEE